MINRGSASTELISSALGLKIRIPRSTTPRSTALAIPSADADDVAAIDGSRWMDPDKTVKQAPADGQFAAKSMPAAEMATSHLSGPASCWDTTAIARPTPADASNSASNDLGSLGSTKPIKSTSIDWLGTYLYDPLQSPFPLIVPTVWKTESAFAILIKAELLCSPIVQRKLGQRLLWGGGASTDGALYTDDSDPTCVARHQIGPAICSSGQDLLLTFSVHARQAAYQSVELNEYRSRPWNPASSKTPPHTGLSLRLDGWKWSRPWRGLFTSGSLRKHSKRPCLSAEERRAACSIWFSKESADPLLEYSLLAAKPAAEIKRHLDLGSSLILQDKQQNKTFYLRATTKVDEYAFGELDQEMAICASLHWSSFEFAFDSLVIASQGEAGTGQLISIPIDGYRWS